jgi:hypothetical protein
VEARYKEKIVKGNSVSKVGLSGVCITIHSIYNTVKGRRSKRRRNIKRLRQKAVTISGTAQRQPSASHPLQGGY